MPRMLLSVLAAALLSAPLCGQPAPAQPPAKAGVSRYACPMKCEGDKAYASEGKCPVCGMALKPVAAPAFALTLASAGGPPKGNEPTQYSLGVVDSAGAAVKGLREIDGKKLHVYTVLRDLASFTHLTPDANESGAFRFEQTLPPGEYMVFARFLPATGSEQVVTTSLTVSGKPANPRAMGVDADRPKSVDGCSITVDGWKDARAGSEAKLKFRITVDGKDADTDQLLGHAGNVVLISHDRKQFVAATPGTGLEFSATPPAPGLYRVWLQFQRGGKVSSAAFNFEVAHKN